MRGTPVILKGWIAGQSEAIRSQWALSGLQDSGKFAALLAPSTGPSLNQRVRSLLRPTP